MIKRIFESLLSPEGRRAWALIFLVGGGMVMTIYAAIAMYLVRTNASYVLYLGLAAHVIIFVVITAFAGLLVRRTLSAKVLGSEFSVSDAVDQGAQAGAAAGAVAGAAVGAVAGAAAVQEKKDAGSEG